MFIDIRTDGPNRSDGEPIATDSDIEELERELKRAEQKAKRRTIYGIVFSLLTFILGLLL